MPATEPASTTGSTESKLQEPSSSKQDEASRAPEMTTEKSSEPRPMDLDPPTGTAPLASGDRVVAGIVGQPPGSQVEKAAVVAGPDSQSVQPTESQSTKPPTEPLPDSFTPKSSVENDGAQTSTSGAAIEPHTAATPAEQLSSATSGATPPAAVAEESKAVEANGRPQTQYTSGVFAPIPQQPPAMPAPGFRAPGPAFLAPPSAPQSGLAVPVLKYGATSHNALAPPEAA